MDLSHLRLPVTWEDPTFVPFDYGWFAFVYNREDLPKIRRLSLDALAKAPESPKILVQDPRTSTPGLGLLLWLRKVYGDGAGDMWQALESQDSHCHQGMERGLRTLPRWRGAARAELHHLARLPPHRRERFDRFEAAVFEEGHYLQVEVAAKLRTAPNPELADRFLSFVVSEGFQQHIPTGNWMFPVIALSGGLPEGFSQPLASEQTLSFASRGGVRAPPAVDR